jgi:type II restriction/modification system DNA methylase subunit YeeA
MGEVFRGPLSRKAGISECFEEAENASCNPCASPAALARLAARALHGYPSDSMTPSDFVRKWSDSSLRERQGSHEHFLDLCAMLGQPTPAQDDPHGDHYCFERGAEKTGGGDGWADVWRKGCFGWEYKGKHKDLNAALRQLQAYALNLQNPPYLVVCDMERIIVHTNWTNTISRKYEFSLYDLLDPANLAIVRKVFEGSADLKPTLSPQELTRKVAVSFGDLGRRLQERKDPPPPQAIAHFLNRLVFCMFAEKAGLLPDGLFTRLIRACERRPEFARAQLGELFAKMSAGGLFGADVIRWFNGGLFDDAEVLELERADFHLIAETASEHDWSQIDPAIFGTLFEEALKVTGRRAALGAHYTDREKIMKIVDPVIVRPLMAEWDAALGEIKTHLDTMAAATAERGAVLERAAEALKSDIGSAKSGEAARRREIAAAEKARDAAYGAAKDRLEVFLARLGAFRVLDPACGSGNFLYVALHALCDIEKRALVDADRLGLAAPAPRVGLDSLKGIEIEPYAAELARVTLWIGDLQWRLKNSYQLPAEPILASLDQIECRDALLNPDGTEAEWPKVDAIIGNPPFLGGKRMRDSLGDAEVERLFSAFRGVVPAEADLVTYWVAKGWKMIQAGSTARAGLVTTNSIRGGASRRVLDPIADADAMMMAWADEPWVLEGAAVRVSMIGFGKGFVDRELEGHANGRINADLTGSGLDLTKALTLTQNAHVAFMGDTKGGAFDIPGDLARQWLELPLNPNGRPNADVLKPWRNAMDLTRRPSDKWIIDFGWTMTEQQAAFYEAPFAHVNQHIKSERVKNNREAYKLYWWRHVEARRGMWKALLGKARFVITPRVATYRSFVWTAASICPDSATIVITRDDETTFGVLHSKHHQLWSLRLGTSLGVGNDPRYTPSTTFETFPFPKGLTPNIPAADYADDPRAIAIAEAAAELNRLREMWLNPADLVRIEPEVVPGYPDRILPRDDAAAKVLKTRTLTNLYNQRPAWLDNAHRRLDAAVAAAYSWPADLPDEEVLARLFALNQERAGVVGHLS